MPVKPFEYMIVKLTKDFGLHYPVGSVCIVQPYSWYGNTNGWNKNDPEAVGKAQEEANLYADDPFLYSDHRTYWNQERGFVVSLPGLDSSIIVSRYENYWEILNIDGVDKTNDDFPDGALEAFRKYEHVTLGSARSHIK